MTDHKRVFNYAVEFTPWEDDTFIAYRTENPSFLFTAETEEEVIAQVEEALKFYIECEFSEDFI